MLQNFSDEQKSFYPRKHSKNNDCIKKAIKKYMKSIFSSEKYPLALASLDRLEQAAQDTYGMLYLEIKEIDLPGDMDMVLALNNWTTQLQNILNITLCQKRN